MLSKREKILWLVILVIIVAVAIAATIIKVKNSNDAKEEELLKERQQKTNAVEEIFTSLGLSTQYLNLDKNGLIEEPYSLTKDIEYNDTELQIRINFYNNYKTDKDSDFKPVSVEKIKKEFQIILDTGEISDILNDYRTTYSVNMEYYNGYRKAIGGIFNRYTRIHLDFPIDALEDLTPEQINKLDEVYRGEKTIDEITL